MADTIYQESEGLLSPYLRRQRLQRVARLVPPDSTVLDLACGSGLLRAELPEGCRYFGADRLPASPDNPFDAFCQIDLARPGWRDELAAHLPEPPDVITAVAFLEHIADYESFIAECRHLLRDWNGLIAGTTPHPRGRRIHDALARVGICSRHGADEHETFLNRDDLDRAAHTAGGKLETYATFLGGLNQIFAIRFDYAN